MSESVKGSRAKFSEGDYPVSVTTRTVGGKEYVVKSVFVGKQDIQSAILKLAEKKAIAEMGL